MNISKQLHYGVMGRVILDGGATTPFQMSNGVKQGCVLAPTFFGLYLTTVLMEATRDLSSNINICIKSGELFKLLRPRAAGKISYVFIQGLLYADECALVEHLEEDLQEMSRIVNSAFSIIGLVVSIKKTEIIHQPGPGVPNLQP